MEIIRNGNRLEDERTPVQIDGGGPRRFVDDVVFVVVPAGRRMDERRVDGELLRQLLGSPTGDAVVGSARGEGLVELDVERPPRLPGLVVEVYEVVVDQLRLELAEALQPRPAAPAVQVLLLRARHPAGRAPVEVVAARRRVDRVLPVRDVLRLLEFDARPLELVVRDGHVVRGDVDRDRDDGRPRFAPRLARGRGHVLEERDRGPGVERCLAPLPGDDVGRRVRARRKAEVEIHILLPELVQHVEAGVANVHDVARDFDVETEAAVDDLDVPMERLARGTRAPPREPAPSARAVEEAAADQSRPRRFVRHARRAHGAHLLAAPTRPQRGGHSFPQLATARTVRAPVLLLTSPTAVARGQTGCALQLRRHPADRARPRRGHGQKPECVPMSSARLRRRHRSASARAGRHCG
mmetsp:Transcript_33117/g.107576  ORF Transcript_33117/g.107576 Transcript_33117/m.107576 type:complete len:411 (-) Transcript_33117:3-1235(-)